MNPFVKCVRFSELTLPQSVAYFFSSPSGCAIVFVHRKLTFARICHCSVTTGECVCATFSASQKALTQKRGNAIVRRTAHCQ